MKSNDAQLGRPQIVYVDTIANIEALTAVDGMIAYATDTGSLMVYNGESWSVVAALNLGPGTTPAQVFSEAQEIDGGLGINIDPIADFALFVTGLPNARCDILGGSTALGDPLADDTDKAFRFAFLGYDNDWTPFVAFFGASTAGAATAYFGGSSSYLSTVNDMAFATTIGNGIPVGRLRLQMTKEGRYNFGFQSNVPRDLFNLTNSQYFSPFYTYNGSTYTSRALTGRQRNSIFTVLSTTNDIIYPGIAYSQFDTIYVKLATPGVGATLVFQYFSGTTNDWASLSVSDETLNLTRTGVIRFAVPSDWIKNTINSSSAYWLKISTSTIPSTAPVVEIMVSSDRELFMAWPYHNDTSPGFMIDRDGNVAVGGGVASETFNVYGDALVADPAGTLGAEKITNTSFTTDSTGWTLNTGWTRPSTYVEHNADGIGTLGQASASMVTPMVVGEVYALTFTVSSYTAGDLTPYVGGVRGMAVVRSDTFTMVFKAVDTSGVKFYPSSNFRARLDNISLKRIQGGDVYVAGKIDAATAEIGDVLGGNYAEFEADGTLKFNGNATVWKDVFFPQSPPKTTGAGNPSLGTIIGNLRGYSYAINDADDFDPQEYPHDGVTNSTITWHVHWVSMTNVAAIRYVKWEIEFSWALPSGAMISPVTNSVEFAIPANTPANTHYLTDIVAYNPVNVVPGSMFWVRLKRIAASGTAPANDPFVAGVHYHYPVDTLGSRQITSK